MNHLITLGRSLAVVTFCLALAASARAMEIRIDFAANSTTGNPGGNWNTLSSASGSIANLTDFTTGSPSNFSLTVTDNLGGPGNSNAGQWTATPAFRSWIDPVATNDYHFVQDSSGNPTGQITFSGAGLDPNRTYRVEVLGSRSFTNTNGTFRVGGALSDNLNSDLYSAFDDGYNDHQVMTWRSVKPVGGQLVLDLENTAPYAAGYLSAMRVTDAPEQTILFDLGSSGQQTPGRWNNATSMQNGHKVLGAIDAGGLQTGVSLAVLAPFGDINTLGIVSDAAGFAATAQRDSLAVGTPAVVQLEGLQPGRQYDITLFGSRQTDGVDNRTSAYTISGVTQYLLNESNTQNSVAFTGVAADGHGHIQIEVAAFDQNGYLGALEIGGSFPASEPPKPSIFFDFGSSDSGYTTSGDWNNVTSTATGLKITDAVDSLGQVTTVDLTITDAFGGVNSLGELSDDAGFPASAQRDSFYLNSADNDARIRIDGLDPLAWYDITLFGSRQSSDATPPRSIDFEIKGQTITLDNYGNTANAVTFFDVQPLATGELLIDFHRTQGADFGYFGVLQITQVPLPEPSSLGLIAAGLVAVFGLGVRSRRRR